MARYKVVDTTHKDAPTFVCWASTEDEARQTARDWHSAQRGSAVAVVDEDDEVLLRLPADEHHSDPDANRPSIRRSRVQLLDLERDLTGVGGSGNTGPNLSLSLHVEDFAGCLPDGDLKAALNEGGLAIVHPGLSQHRREAGVAAVAAACRRMHREVSFQPSTPVAEEDYNAFLDAACREDENLSLGCSINLASIAKRSGLGAQTLHAAAARAIDDGLAYVSDAGEQPYSILIRHEEVQRATLTTATRGPARNSESRARGRVDSPSLETDDVLACILVATDTEWTQLKRVFGVSSDDPRACASLPNGRVVLAKAPEMGMSAASTLTTRLIHEYRPSVVAMCGVAGGLGVDAKLGNLVVGLHVWNYALGKHEDGGFAPDIRQIRLQENLERRLASNESLKLYLTGLQADSEAPDPKPETVFAFHMGAMVSGPAVVANDEIRESIESQSRKIKAVDMEAYGVVHASAHARDTPTPAFVAKAISDYADPNKDVDVDYQKYCAWLSAHAALWVLKQGYVSN